jgi:hypothetical protein
MNLYQINEEFLRAFEAAFDPETGEIDPEAEKELVKWEAARAEKVENYGLFIKNLKAESDALKAEIDTLTRRKKTVDKKINWLKNYLSVTLAGEPFKTPRLVITWRKSEAVEIVATIDELKSLYIGYPDYIKKHTEYKLDKTAIKTALKSGEALPFAELKQNKNIQIK